MQALNLFYRKQGIRMWTKIMDTITHNKALIVAFGICAILSLWGYGCEPTTRSPFDYTKQVTRLQLDNQVKSYANDVNLAYSDLQKQEQIRAAILNAGLVYAQGGGINPLGLACTLMGILGIGVAVDNRTKDAVIVSKTNALNAITNNNKGTT